MDSITTTIDDLQLVVFHVGSERYAVPTVHVREIIRYAEPRSIASPDPSVRGIISLRGHTVEVVDVAQRLGLPGQDAEGTMAKIVILDAPGSSGGIVVDDVDEVIAVPAAAIEAAPDSSDAAAGGIVRLGEELVVMLDPQALAPALSQA